MAAKVKTWVWVVAAIVVVGILGLVAMAAIGFYFASQHIDTRVASPASAARDFEAVRARFTGQKPLIELDDNGRFVRANTDRPVPAHASSPEKLHVLAYDPDDGRIVQLSIPFWLLRLKAGGASIDFNGREMDFEDLRVTVADLERFGPTLIAEHKAPDGSHVIVWSQWRVLPREHPLSSVRDGGSETPAFRPKFEPADPACFLRLPLETEEGPWSPSGLDT